jgi:hypothetical protein
VVARADVCRGKDARGLVKAVADKTMAAVGSKNSKAVNGILKLRSNGQGEMVV